MEVIAVGLVYLLLAANTDAATIPGIQIPCTTCPTIPEEKPACLNENDPFRPHYQSSLCERFSRCGLEMCDDYECYNFCYTCTCGFGYECRRREQQITLRNHLPLVVDGVVVMQSPRFALNRECVPSQNGFSVDIRRP